MERFWSKVDKSGECWLWTAGIHHTGYGQFRYKYKMQGAHRVAYELTVGKIPEGLTLDHLCRVRHCVNPSHLEPVTNKENLLRGEGACAIHARKTHCIRGHEFLGDNLSVYPDGERECKTCKNMRNREWRKKHKEPTK